MTTSAWEIDTVPEKWYAIVWGVLLAFLLLASPALLAVESAAAVGPSIYGKVTSAVTGVPLAGAEVWLFGRYPSFIQVSTKTDTAGNYSFTPPAGTYAIEVSHLGFNWVVTGDRVFNGATAIKTDITMQWTSRITAVQGRGRFETAVAASKEAYPAGLDPDGDRTVVIATGRNWPDALGGSALAGALDGPMLLVDTNVIPAAVFAEIGRLKADKAIILGGTGAVGPTVETALRSKLGDADVSRISGADRYQTANNIAAKVREVLGPYYDEYAFVATGENFPDALAAAPLAAGYCWPIYLSHPTEGLSPATVTAIDETVSDVVILGGTGAVSTATEDGLKTCLGEDRVERLAGNNRYTTAVAIATYAAEQTLWFDWDGVGLATGTNFPDALAGGVLQGYNGSVMLLTPANSLHPAAAGVLSANSVAIDSVVFFGGTGALSQPVRHEALQLISN